VKGGEIVTVSGQCFATENLLQVTFGGTPVSFTRVSPTTITVTTPAVDSPQQSTVIVEYSRNGTFERYTINSDIAFSFEGPSFSPQTMQCRSRLLSAFLYTDKSALVDNIAAAAAAGTVVPVVVIVAVIVAVILIRRRQKGGLQIRLVDPDYLAVAFTSDREPKFKMNGDLRYAAAGPCRLII